MKTNQEILRELQDSCHRLQKQVEDSQNQLLLLSRQIEQVITQQEIEDSAEENETVDPVIEQPVVDVMTETTDDSDKVVEEISNPEPELQVGSSKQTIREERYEPEPVYSKETSVSQEKTRASEDIFSMSLEANIGKKLLPIAASALILFAIILFGNLIQPVLNDTIKAGIMGFVSLAITAFGVMKMKRENKYYKLYSALAGCGVAACYVSSLVSYFALEVLDDNSLMICLGTWIVAVMALTKFKSAQFTYICYIGILIAAGMTIWRWNDNPAGLIAYIVSISALFALNYSHEYRKVAWYFYQFPIVMACMAKAYDNDTVSTIIFVCTVLVLVSQILHYEKNTSEKKYFTPSLFISLLALYVSRPLVRDYAFFLNLIMPYHTNTNYDLLIFAGTTIVLAVYFYQVFARHDSKVKYNPFYWWYFPLAICLPVFYYNGTYNTFLGHFILPSVIIYLVGHFSGNHIFRKTGLVYLLFVSFSVPEIYNISTQSGYVLYYGCWFYAVIWCLMTLLTRRNNDKAERYILIGLAAWFIMLLRYYSWIDGCICYMLIAVYAFALNSPRLRNNKVLDAPQFIDSASLIITYIVSAMYTYIVVSSNLDDDLIFGAPFLQIYETYAAPLCAFTGSLLLWSVGCFRKNSTMLKTSYILLPISMCMLSEEASDIAIVVLFAGLTIAMAFHTRKFYHSYNKAMVAMCLACIPYRLSSQNIISDVEFWICASVICLVCTLTPVLNNGNEEEDAKQKKALTIISDIILFIGMLHVRYDKSPLFLYDNIQGTESVMSVLLIIVYFSMLIVSVIRQLTDYKPENEKSISIYNGIKFTLMILAILFRFSALSYVISISGIILSAAFIIIGFKYTLKGLRLYGLVLSMLCVVKLIFSDIVFDNAFYRPVSFLIAGILLFVISYVYFKIEKINNRQSSGQQIQ